MLPLPVRQVAGLCATSLPGTDGIGRVLAAFLASLAAGHTHCTDRARRDLADHRLDHLTIATIAHRWGFARPADFSRTFRRQTGMPPREYRDIT